MKRNCRIDLNAIFSQKITVLFLGHHRSVDAGRVFAYNALLKININYFYYMGGQKIRK